MVEVVQADRDAQAQLYENVGKPGMAEEIRAGLMDDHPGVQAFAAHRLAHLTPNTDLSDDTLFARAASLVYRIEAAGHLSYEGQNLERWKQDARELAPLLRARSALGDTQS